MNLRVAVLLAFLTFAAGYCDAVAFFGLGVFTANMTGNTVLLAGSVAAPFFPQLSGKLAGMLPAVALAAFVAGAAATALALRGETGRPPVRTLAVMATVAVLLGVAAYLFGTGPGATTACVVLLAVVAGMQSVVAARAGVAGITTIVVTGVMVTAIVNLLGEPRAPEVRRSGWAQAADWAVYAGGALAGMAGIALLGGRAFWPATAIVAVSLAVL